MKKTNQAKENPLLHPVSAERGVLGCLLLTAFSEDANESLSSIISGLETLQDSMGVGGLGGDFSRHFSDGFARSAIHVVRRLHEEGGPADIVTVSAELGKIADPSATLLSLRDCMNSAAQPKDALAYGRIVFEATKRRNLLQAAKELQDQIMVSSAADTDSLANHFQDKLSSLFGTDSLSSAGLLHRDEALASNLDYIDKAYHREDKSQPMGLPTGFYDLDNELSGLHPGDLVIIAGRPAMGKTTFAQNIGENLSSLTKKATLIFSLEMPGTQLSMRSLSTASKVSLQKLRSGRLEDQDFVRITAGLESLRGAPIFFDQGTSTTPADIRSRARKFIKQHGNLGLVVIDYIQLMSSGGFGPQREQEISSITRDLKKIARELDIPVIALSQLNRSLEQRPNKRPMMSDLRESGAIEQDADVILFVYRDEVYHPETPDRGIAEIIIGKQRNGPISTVRLGFSGQFAAFENYLGASF